MGRTQTGRIASLDGLRGVACLSVLLLHVGMMMRPLGDGFDYGLVPGSAAVMVFFVLSGAVCSAGPLSRDGYDWGAYFPRRAVRLGVPLAAAVVLGLAASLVAWRVGADSAAAAAVAWDGGPGEVARGVLMQFDFLFNVSSDTVTLAGGPLARVNPPLWSMSWEVWFSLSLPLAVALLGRVRSDALAAAGLLACSLASHATGYFPLALCVPFLLGGLLAKHLGRMAAWRPSPALEAFLLAGALLLVEAPALAGASGLAGAALLTARDAGAAALVALAAADGLFRRALSMRPALFLGKVSFSLYLTHALAVGALEVLLPAVGVISPIAQAAVAVVACVAVGWAFWRLVEKPAAAWSLSLGPSRGPRE